VAAQPPHHTPTFRLQGSMSRHFYLIENNKSETNISEAHSVGVGVGVNVGVWVAVGSDVGEIVGV
jgi:hypothetical protein